jgi:hypothetical protein
MVVVGYQDEGLVVNSGIASVPAREKVFEVLGKDTSGRDCLASRSKRILFRKGKPYFPPI